MAFFDFPLGDQARMIRSIEAGVRTLPAAQLEAELTALKTRREYDGSLAVALMVRIYEAEVARRVDPTVAADYWAASRTGAAA